MYVYMCVYVRHPVVVSPVFLFNVRKYLTRVSFRFSRRLLLLFLLLFRTRSLLYRAKTGISNV